MFSLHLDIDTVYTLTTRTDGQKGSYPTPPPTAPFTLPYKDDFEGEALVLKQLHFHVIIYADFTAVSISGVAGLGEIFPLRPERDPLLPHPPGFQVPSVSPLPSQPGRFTCFCISATALMFSFPIFFSRTQTF